MTEAGGQSGTALTSKQRFRWFQTLTERIQPISSMCVSAPIPCKSARNLGISKAASCGRASLSGKFGVP